MAALEGATSNDTTEHVAEDKMDVDDEEEQEEEEEEDEKSSEVEDDDSEEDDEDADDRNEEEEDGDPVESLVSGRQKRATAGSKYQQLLNATLREDAEDEVSLLFAEEGEDEEFDETKVDDPAEGDEDDSSTDEEDQAGGPDDELAGEKELEKQERAAKRLQKRKAEQALAKAAPARKKVKIEAPTDSPRRALETPSLVKTAERTRKRPERVSWLPSDADAPVRTSSRTLSVQNKERTMESMKESEARRIRQLEVIENAQKRKEAVKVQPMTQAERMAEAVRIARINSKSLNTWEEAEAERAARQKARLDALHNRTLEGPVIRWYSGPAEWTDGRLTYVGRRPKIEEILEVQEQKNDEILTDEPTTHLPSASDGSATKSEAPVVSHGDQHMLEHDDRDTNGQTSLEISEAVPHSIPPTGPEPASDIPTEIANALSSAVPQTNPGPTFQTPASRIAGDSGDFLGGLEYYASLDEDSNSAAATKIATQLENTSNGLPQEGHGLPVRPSTSVESDSTTKPINLTEAEGSHNSNNMQNLEEKPTFMIHDDSAQIAPTPQHRISSTTAPNPQSTTIAQPPSPPKEITYSAHQSLTLLNYPATAPLHTRDILRRILFAWPSPSHLPNTTSSILPTYASTSTAGTAPTTTSTGAPKRAKKEEISAFTALRPLPPVCVISGQQARYRDPVSGLPYRGINEFKSLRGLAGRRADGGEDQGQKGSGGPIWSALLGAYVGAGGRRGHPRLPTTTTSGGVAPAGVVAGSVQRESVEAIKWRAAAKVPEAFVGGLVPAPAPAPADVVPEMVMTTIPATPSGIGVGGAPASDGPALPAPASVLPTSTSSAAIEGLPVKS